MDVELLKYVFFTNTEEKEKIKYYKLQASIIDKLERHKFAMCFDEAGMGKTVQGIYAIWNCFQKKLPGEKVNILIIAPNLVLAEKWQEEIKSFLGIDFTIAYNREEKGSHNINYDSTVDNLYITYNSSNYSNLGITRLTNYNQEWGGSKEDSYVNIPVITWEEEFGYERNRKNIDDYVEQNYLEGAGTKYFDNKEDYKKYVIRVSQDKKVQYIYKSKWDLMIIDEAHLVYPNYLKALLRESVEIDNEPYTSFLGWHEAKQLMMLTATPIKANDEGEDSCSWLLETAKKIAPTINNNIKIQADEMLTFDIDLPYQRYFKEVVLESTELKTRTVSFLQYQLTDELEMIWKSKGYASPHSACGNVFLMIDEFISNVDSCNNDLIIQAYRSYKVNGKPCVHSLLPQTVR